MNTGMFGLRDDLNSEDGVTAELKEVVVNTNLFDPQHVLENSLPDWSRLRRRW
jgi:hypothetical protein